MTITPHIQIPFGVHGWSSALGKRGNRYQALSGEMDGIGLGAPITELELENERTGGMAGGGYDEGRSEASTASPYAPRIRVSQQV